MIKGGNFTFSLVFVTLTVVFALKSMSILVPQVQELRDTNQQKWDAYETNY